MAMEINGNVPDYSVRKQNYGGYAAQNVAESNRANDVKQKETEKTSEKSQKESTAEYAKKLAKLVPSVEFKVGSSFASAKNGKTLTVSSALLEKMRNDPEKEKEMKELIKGVESMTRLSESLNKANGWTTVFRHSYIDENGNYCHIALIRNDFMLNMSDKLREERRKNSEKLIEKQKENAAEKKEALEEKLEERKTEKEKETSEEITEETADKTQAERILEEKRASSQDGMIYMDDGEFKTLLEAMKEESGEDKDKAKEQPQAGAVIDLQV